ncbi:MAG: hypothetical protein HC859_00030 [Bacteroidia bacterium]|nr:hypothetical protein [Bacteroidia bacterium]
MDTKRNFSVILPTLLLVITFAATAQGDYTFRVMVNKGANQVKAGKDWVPIKVGAQLKSNDEVKVAENAYLGLVHVNGKPLEVRKAGNHKVIDLASQVSGGSSVLNKYTDFILSENSQKKNNLAATGAVHRGTEFIQVFLPGSEQALVFNDKVTITWDSSAKAPFLVTMSSLFEEELDRIETTKYSVDINLADRKFEYEDNINVKVYSKGDPTKVSEVYTLRRYSKADKTRIKAALTQLGDAIAEETALNKLFLAGFYEQNRLIIDASTAYQEAAKLAPDVPQYREAYEEFLLRAGLKSPKKK